MLKCVLPIALVLALSAAGLAQPAGLEARVDSLIALLVEASDFSGAVLVAKSGEILVAKGYGMASFDLG